MLPAATQKNLGYIRKHVIISYQQPCSQHVPWQFISVLNESSASNRLPHTKVLCKGFPMGISTAQAVALQHCDLVKSSYTSTCTAAKPLQLQTLGFKNSIASSLVTVLYSLVSLSISPSFPTRTLHQNSLWSPLNSSFKTFCFSIRMRSL